MRQSALRNRLIDTIRSNQREFRRNLSDLIDADHLDNINQEILQDDVDNIRSKSSENASAREMMLRWRLRVLDNIQFGLTLTGPAYEDNPIRYANQTFRETTGYTLSQLRGSNPRILQGPMTEASAINALREATQIWEPVTVTLWNYRYDGVPFRNCISITPLRRDDGMITHWLGVQTVIDSLTELSKPELKAVGENMSNTDSISTLK